MSKIYRPGPNTNKPKERLFGLDRPCIKVQVLLESPGQYKSPNCKKGLPSIKAIISVLTFRPA